jgi:hypothetical protein
MPYKNIGTVNAAPFSTMMRDGMSPRAMVGTSMQDSIASGNAFLISELEKRDPLLRKPLESVTYYRDIPVRVGGGYAEFVSGVSLDWGYAEGNADGAVSASSANAMPIMQVNLSKDVFRTHIWGMIARIGIIDMHRQQEIGRSLDEMINEGVRTAYAHHVDKNVYVGLDGSNQFGLVNNPGITATFAATGIGGSTEWDTKDPDEILFDINDAINSIWEASGYDPVALPNHIIMPHRQYSYLATTKVSPIAEKTILTFLLENSISRLNGGGLEVFPTKWCKGAGTGSSQRVVIYAHNKKFLAFDELQPLTRMHTSPLHGAYETLYNANLSETQIYYPQTLLYVDGV